MTKYFPAGIFIITLLLAVIAYPYLPAQVASHWDAGGQVNGYMDKFWGVFLFPVIQAFMLLLFWIIPKIDPKKENIQKFRNVFDRFISVMLTFLLYLFLLFLAWNLNWQFNFVRFLIPAFAMLFYFAGDLIGSAQPNWTIGIRTPWTLSSEGVWLSTHKLGAKLFKWLAVLILASVLLPLWAFWIVTVGIIAATIYLVIYSYLEFRKESMQQ